jgi:glycosyltransferase involved in cell wall biosynthesis
MPKKYSKVSIVIPIYNEEHTVYEIIKRVLKSDTLGLSKEVIIVDDGSVDGTRKQLKKIKDKRFKNYFHRKNKGKGAALRTGFKYVTGDIVLIQDADLEYHPEEYPKLLRPFLNSRTKVVYGSRELSGKNIHSSVLFHMGGRMVTTFANLLYGSNLTDEATGYKLFDTQLLQELPLKCQGFEFCPEVTALILKRKIKIKEIPIKYTARHTNEGKKIRAKDGVKAIWTLFRIRIGLI